VKNNLSAAAYSCTVSSSDGTGSNFNRVRAGLRKALRKARSSYRRIVLTGRGRIVEVLARTAASNVLKFRPIRRLWDPFKLTS